MKHITSTFAAAVLLGLSLTTAQIAVAQTTVQTTTTNSAGTITEFSPDTLVIRTESAPERVRYSYSKTTTYVDETGAPVSMETVKSGLPVTVYYIKEGDRMVASKVIVRRTVKAAAPVVEEKKTTTTTTTSGQSKDKD